MMEVPKASLHVSRDIVFQLRIAPVILQFHPVFPKVAHQHASRGFDVDMKRIGLIPEERFVVQGKLDGFKTAGMNEAGRAGKGVDVLFDMDHFSGVLVEEISGEIDCAEDK